MIPFLLGAALAVVATPSAAQFQGPVENCFTGTGSFKLDISECSMAIATGFLNGPGRASLHTLRGRAYLESGARDAAIADFNRALTLNPASALAHHERGRAFHKGGDAKRAIADYDAALRLNPHYAAAFRNRGTARLHQGRLAEAVADFDAAIAGVNYDPASLALRGIARYFQTRYDDATRDLTAAIDKAYPYPQAALWIYLAERRAGRDGQESLAANAAELVDDNWPAPLIAVYRNRITAETALSAATTPRERTEAHFYLGQLALLGGDKAAAGKHFDAVRALGAVDTVEYAGARLLWRRAR